jgi:hypothetical protein
MRTELHIDPKMTHGRYGELTVLVDGTAVLRSGWGAFIGIMPSVQQILDAVRAAGSKPLDAR